MKLNEFNRQVCADCVKINKIKSLEDLNKRWTEPWEQSIANWFIKNDFIPSHWYKILRCYIENECTNIR